jgi:hypothetical protein
MAKLPDPPPASALQQLEPPFLVIDSGRRLARLYFAGGPRPTTWNSFRHWGPAARARLDHHLLDDGREPYEQARSVLYCATAAQTCIAEVFQGTRVIERSRSDPYLAVFRLVRPVRLLDLSGAFVTQMGASLAIHSGPRNRARAWARALYDAFDHDGILYRSSMNAGALAIALNDRCEQALQPAPDFNRPLADPSLTDLVDACAFELGYLKA